MDVTPLVRAALEVVPGDPAGGMTRLMRAVAETTSSYGCSLWRKRKQQKELIMLAGWYPGNGVITLSRMTISATCAGKAMEGETHCLDNDLMAHGNPYNSHPFIVKNGINRTLAHFVQVPPSESDDGWEGALNLYRRGPRPDLAPKTKIDPPYKDPDITVLRSICGSIPLLFRATREHNALDLFRATEEIVAAYRPPQSFSEWEENLRATIGAFGAVLRRAFCSKELSIFMRKPDEPKTYTCWFTTPGEHKKTSMESVYHYGAMNEGFSALSLLQDQAIRVDDIRHPQEDVARLQQMYPDFQGHASRNVSTKVLTGQHLTDEEAPPHAMMCCRLAADTKVFGFVRCRIVEQGPVIYHEEDTNLLRMVCQSFSQNLAAWWEAHWWDESVEQIAAYHVRGSGPRAHLTDALELIDRLVPGADINTARLLNENHEYLDFVAHSEKAEHELDKSSRNLLNERFSLLASAPRTVAGDVVKSGRAERCSGQDPRITYSFRGVTEMIVAPIKDHKNAVYGVLDARTRSEFPPYALRLMEIIGRQVGMQHAHLLEEERNQENQERTRLAEVQNYSRQLEDEKRNVQAFEDAAHQIKTPLNAARKLVEMAVKFRQQPDLGLLQTSLRRADLASKLINTFADIASGRRLDLSNHEIIPEDLVRIIALLTSDIGRMSEQSRNLKFDFDDDSILRHAPETMIADKDLVAQVVYNLLENAEKYSFPNTHIRCFGSKSKSGKFCINVTNRGERIEPHEVHLCIQRRWRARQQGWKTGSGSGLGLYIVDKIMAAHSGRVVVIPTTDKGITEIRLEF